MRLDAREKIVIRLIAAIAIPAIVTNLTVPLLGLCDIAIAGHRGGAAFIAALAVGTSMFNMIYWIFGFLRMGSSGLTARAFGARDCRAQSALLLRALTVALVTGMAVIALQRPLCALLLGAMDVDSSTASMARDYFAIAVWGAPAVLSTYALTGWMLGMQNSKAPMAVSIAADLANIAASLLFVFGFGMEIKGIAAGTLAAQWIAALLGMRCAIRIGRALPRPRLSELTGKGIGEFFKVNSDIFLRTLCLVAVTLWFTRVGASQGAVMLAVNALLMQLFTLFSYFMDGFAFSAEALTGRFRGSGNHAALRVTLRLELIAGALMALLFTALYFGAGDMILGILTDDMSVRERAGEFLPWAVTVPLAGFMAFSCDGIFIGAGMTRRMLGSVAVAMAVFFILCILLVEPMGNHGLWIAFLAWLAVRGAMLALWLRHVTG